MGSRKRNQKAGRRDVPWLAVGLRVGHQSVRTSVLVISRLVLLAPRLLVPELNRTHKRHNVYFVLPLECLPKCIHAFRLFLIIYLKVKTKLIRKYKSKLLN